MTYQIIISRPEQRDLRSVWDERVRRRLSGAMDALAENPYPPRAQKLRADDEVWRIRVGDWRICYIVDGDQLIVLVLMVGQRGDIYERLRRRLG